MKSEFVYVQPKSRQAKQDFVEMMNKLHSCKVMHRDQQYIYLQSISGYYDFWVKKENDEDWEMI